MNAMGKSWFLTARSTGTKSLYAEIQQPKILFSYRATLKLHMRRALMLKARTGQRRQPKRLEHRPVVSRLTVYVIANHHKSEKPSSAPTTPHNGGG